MKNLFIFVVFGALLAAGCGEKSDKKDCKKDCCCGEKEKDCCKEKK